MYSGCIEDKGDNKEPGEGGAVSNAGRGEPSTRKRAQGSWSGRRVEKEGKIHSKGCNKKGNADQRQQYESREGQLSRCSSFVGEFHGRH